MKNLTREQKIFIKITQAYVAAYPQIGFQFYFDEVEQPVIGNGSKVVKTRFVKADYLFKRIFREGNMGLGEGYSEGLIQTKDEDYKELLLVFVSATSLTILRQLSLLDIVAIVRARAAGYFGKVAQNTDINSHYSLSEWFDDEADSNKFFFYWLTDDYHLYSCGKWDDGVKTLNEAQLNKLQFYAQRLNISQASRGKTLLDLGCGWGGVLFFMAEHYGVRCKGLTLSTAQFQYISQEIVRRNLQDLVSVELKNVYEMSGKYDYIISIGMLEHINRYDDLYSKMTRSLNPEGQALLHSIYTERIYYRTDPWLLKYIFPYGASPHFSTNMRRYRKYFGYVDTVKMPPLSYPKTLDCWFADFCKNEDKIRILLHNSKVKDVDFAVRTFKHYLAVASASLTKSGFVANTLLKNPPTS
jgi:cyclopropane-fatty-acyl-phospholipid synthase